MHTIFAGHRHATAHIALASLAMTMLMPATAYADDQAVTFELRPHCNSNEYQEAFAAAEDASPVAGVDDSTCPSFSVKDPLSRQTDVLKSGDPLDMDLVIHNPSGQPIERFRAWIAYDPTVLEGELLDIAKQFPTPTPGEQAFSPSDGYVKLSGTADAPQTSRTVIVARIRFHTLSTSLSSIPVTFYDSTGAPTSHTGIFTSEAGGSEMNIEATTLGVLLVRLEPDVSTSSASSEAVGVVASTASSVAPTAVVSSAATSGSQMSALPPPAPAPTVFNLLQVQHLRVTTEGSSVFLAWDILPSSELVGYNLYYGTVSGKYIQKRSVDKGVSNITVRALNVGTTYYFSIRGINAKGMETDFSQEVGISVGNPATSTAPLTAGVIGGAKTPKTGGKVSGDTGVSSSLLLFLTLSAVIGTSLAFRRQLKAHTRA